MKIPLTFGQTAFVDQKDYERCIKGPQWYALASRRRDGSIRTYYAVRNILTPEGSITSQLMHRFILRLSDIKIHTDHKNGNGLDNRRKNISKVNNLQNSQNRVRLDSRSTSGVMGVYWDKTNNKWVAEIISYGKYKFLGRFSALKDAKSARKRAEAERKDK